MGFLLSVCKREWSLNSRQLCWEIDRNDVEDKVSHKYFFLPIEAGHFVLLRNWTLPLRRRGNISLSDPSLFCSQENLMTITSN